MTSMNRDSVFMVRLVPEKCGVVLGGEPDFQATVGFDGGLRVVQLEVLKGLKVGWCQFCGRTWGSDRKAEAK
jgi:hypothetical protein